MKKQKLFKLNFEMVTWSLINYSKLVKCYDFEFDCVSWLSVVSSNHQIQDSRNTNFKWLCVRKLFLVTPFLSSFSVEVDKKVISFKFISAIKNTICKNLQNSSWFTSVLLHLRLGLRIQISDLFSPVHIGRRRWKILWFLRFSICCTINSWR